MARRSTFTFDLSKPLKKGALLKQGALHKAFKYRLFVLYPGFLVYYENETKWRIDLSKGETLGNRVGAVKLKGATVSIARNAPKGCKFGISLTAPDPANKRQTYVMNATSKEERDLWIEAIHKATPTSPHQKRKENHTADTKPKEKANSSELAHPAQTLRQNTACDAAIAVANCTDKKEDQKALNEVIDSVNHSLQDLGHIPTRHNTATMAALTLSMEKDNRFEEDKETSIDLILSYEEIATSSEEGDSHEASSTPETGIDMKSPEPDTPESGTGTKSPEPDTPESDTGTKSPEPDTPESDTGTKIPEPEERTELESSVENSQTNVGEATVVTTVTVVSCASTNSSQESAESSPLLAREKEESVGSNILLGEEMSEKRHTSSTLVLVKEDINSSVVTISINLNSYDSDDTLSDEESLTDLSKSQEETVKEKGEEEGKDGEKAKAKEVVKEEVPPTKDSLAVKEHAGSNGIGSGSESPVLSVPFRDRRKTSVPFIEKKGYLYKMGGQRKTWKLRYFVLRPGNFHYFKDGAPHRKPLGEVKLKNLSIFFPGIGERKQSFQFTVHTESSWNRRPDYVLAGQSEREMKEWINAFKLAGQKVGGSIGGSPIDSDAELETGH